MKVNQIKIGSILSYIQMGLMAVIQLVYTPVMIRLLGQSEYGLYNTVASTISMLSILSLGFNSGYLKYYSVYKRNNDHKSISRLNGLFLFVFIIIGLVSLVCGLYLTIHIEMVFDTGLTNAEYSIARVLMFLLTLNLSLSFPMSVFSNIISAHERFVFLKLLGMGKTIVSPLVTLPLLISGYKSIAMVSVTVIVNLVVDVCYLFYVLVVMKERFLLKGLEKGLFISIFTYTFFIAINTLIDQVNWNIDKILLGRFKGTSEVAVYSVGFTLYSVYMMFSTSISGVFAPRVHMLVNSSDSGSKKQRALLTDFFTKVGRIQFLVLGLIASGIFLYGNEFITIIWAGKGYESSYYVSLLLIIPASIALIQNLGIEIQRAENKHQFRSIVYAIMAVINLSLSVYLSKIYGAIGSAVGTAISLVIANGLIMNVYYYRSCNIDVLFFWKNIGRMSIGMVIPLMIGFILRKYICVTNLSTFILCVLFYSLLYVLSVWCISMNRYEKELLISPVRALFRKR